VRKREARVKVVFEDNDVLVLNKPAGMVVNRAKTVQGETLQDWVEKNLMAQFIASQKGKCGRKRANNIFFCRSGIVHRLDKETSGLILVAKHQEAFEDLQRQFKERRVKKKYLALVHGRLKSKEGEINLPIRRSRKNREKFTVSPEGKKARTKYRVLKYGDHQTLGEFSFLELQTLSGRTHQIRVHLSFLGYPLVSDLKYGGKRGRRDRLVCPRLFLHARYLGFYHPQNKKFRQFISPLTLELKNAILKLCGKNSFHFY